MSTMIRIVGTVIGAGSAVTCALYADHLNAKANNETNYTKPLNANIIGSTSYFAQNLRDRNMMKNACPVDLNPVPYKSSKWDYNWDALDPAEIHKNKEHLEKCDIPITTKHILLVRHGQYVMDEKEDSKRVLTPLGREQADYTGLRLKELGYKFDKIYISTMQRAKDTAEVIMKHLPSDTPYEYCNLLPEGAPIPPEPPGGKYRHPKEFYNDGARIEAAFRKHFYRASPKSEKKNEYYLLVCHANVIRYLLVRALQLPDDSWLRFSLKHGSITHIVIKPDGRVIAQSVGDIGFAPADKLTTS